MIRLWYNRCGRRKTLLIFPRPEVAMRGQFLGAVIVLVGVAALFAADKDTALATNTRAKKLTVKVTVDFKEEMLEDCIKEISRQLEDAGLGSLSFHPGLGVSKNQRISYSAKAQRVAEVLDGRRKKPGLGYFVVPKDKARSDGGIEIPRGEEGGGRKGQEPKGAAKPSPKVPPEPKDKPADKPA